MGKELLHEVEEFRSIDCIRMESKKTGQVIDPLGFEAVACETLMQFGDTLGISPDALKALQAGAEEHLTRVFENSTKWTISRHSDQLECRDVQQARLNNMG